MSRNPRCTWINNDGTRCARRVPPPDTLCHLHVAVANGGTISPNKRIELDEIEILKKLAQKGEPAIQLRAVDLLLQLKNDAKDPRDEERTQRAKDIAQLSEHASPHQLERLRELMRETRQIERDIREYIAAGGRPAAQEPEYAPVIEHQEPAGTAEELPGPTTEEPSAPVIDERQVDQPQVTTWALLPRERWAAVGLFEATNGIVTHALGDDHAAAILRGDISYEDAAAAHDAAQRQFGQMLHRGEIK